MDLASTLATPPAPPPPSAPPTETAPSTPAAAEAEIARIRGDKSHPFNRADHRDHMKAVEAMTALYGVRNGPTAPEPDALVLEGDPPPPSPITDTVLRDALPEAPSGHPWNQTMVEELSKVAAPNGMASSLPLILGVLSDAAERRTVYTDDEAHAELVRRHGEHETEKILADAQAAGALLPARIKTWLKESGHHSNPRLIHAVASAWRRRRTGQEDTDR